MNEAPSLLQLILSFLGGGVVAAVGNWFHQTRSLRRQRQIDQLSLQLAELYGPLYFLTSQNQRLFDLNRDIHDQYNEHIVQPNWEQSEPTQSRVRAAAEDTIGLANAYVRRVVENNHKVMQLLESKWQFVDHEDVEIFSQFQIDHTRFQTEVESGNFKNVPFEISQGLGAISYMRPQMINRVEYKVVTKRQQVRELVAPWYTRRDF